MKPVTKRRPSITSSSLHDNIVIDDSNVSNNDDDDEDDDVQYDHMPNYHPKRHLNSSSHHEQHSIHCDLQSVKPLADVYKTRRNYHYYIDMPGFTKDSIDIDLSENGSYLIVKGHRQRSLIPSQMNKNKCLVFERKFGNFKRVFKLPGDVIVERIKAEMQEGELEITVPRHQKHSNKLTSQQPPPTQTDNM